MNAMKCQASLGLLLTLSAYFAFLALLISAAHASFEKSIQASGSASGKLVLQGACFYIDSFSLDGKHAVAGKNFSGFSSQGKRLAFGNSSWTCNSTFRFEDGLKVETNSLEFR